MVTIAISMHNFSHAETHFLCQEGNTAQTPLLFRDVNLGDDPMIFAPRVNAIEAIRHFHDRKPSFGLGSEDILIAVIQGNLFDDKNDEYFFLTSLGFPELKNSCSNVGVVSLFYRLDAASEFQQPRSASVKARKEEWWDPKSEAEQNMLLSNSFLLMLLGLIGTLLKGLVAHEDTRRCILDYCQDPFDILEAFKRGVEFSFCKRECQKMLETTAEGKGLMKIAERLTARPFAQPQPSIFISYARDDFDASEKLRDDLQRLGYQHVWKDVYEIVAGAEWEREIRLALEKHHFVVSCLSKAATEKQRYFQKELRVALGLHRENVTHLIPVRLEECEIPDELKPYNYVDLFPDWPAGLESIRLSITRTWKPFEAIRKK